MGTEFFISAIWSTIMVYVAALEDFFLHVERCWFCCISIQDRCPVF